MSSGLIPSNLGMNNSNSIGATKKIFVGGLHYETKDGTQCVFPSCAGHNCHLVKL